MILKYGQSLESFVEEWFKQAAYSIILLRNEGYPCVFYGDFYGIPHDNKKPVKDLETLIRLRKEKSYGEQHDYFVISNALEGEKRMYIGKQFAGEKFIDSLGNCNEEISIDEEGYGNFKVKGKSTSVWVEG